ncbi:hypothetical protein BCS71_08085 [Vibrio lentus]
MTIEVTDWVSIGGGVLSFFAYIEARKANSNSKDAMAALALIVEVSEKTQTYLSKRRATSLPVTTIPNIDLQKCGVVRRLLLEILIKTCLFG